MRFRVCLLLAGITVAACDGRHRHEVFDHTDHVPPGAPRDVFSVTGDGYVTLYWSPPRDADIAGYRVLISRDDFDYYRVADVSWAQRFFVVRGSTLPGPVPFDFQNGTTYWLAVEARDDAGNHSDLSAAAITSDTPRPAGRDLRLYAAGGARHAESGYDFSRSPYGYALEATSVFADVYYAWEGRPVLRAAHPAVVEMQNLGPMLFDDDRASALDEATWVPAAAVTARIGDVIVLKIYEDTRPGNDIEPFNVAEVRVVEAGGESILLDWAYQIQPNNRELKPRLAEDSSERHAERVTIAASRPGIGVPSRASTEE
jgi:hypothetical protein